MMRKTLLLALTSLFVFTSCSKKHDENTMILNGQIIGLKKGTVLLERFVDTSYIAIDSIQIYGDSKFQLQQPLESPEILHLHLRLENGNLLEDRVSFFAEPGEINIYTKLEDLTNPYVEGSKNHSLMLTYYKVAERYKNQNLDLIVEELNAQKEANDSLIKVVKNKRISLLRSSYLATVNFAMQNSEYEIAPFIMMYETPEIQVHYLDTVYNKLTDKVKSGIYGKQLKKRIETIKNTN